MKSGQRETWNVNNMVRQIPRPSQQWPRNLSKRSHRRPLSLRRQLYGRWKCCSVPDLRRGHVLIEFCAPDSIKFFTIKLIDAGNPAVKIIGGGGEVSFRVISIFSTIRISDTSKRHRTYVYVVVLQSRSEKNFLAPGKLDIVVHDIIFVCNVFCSHFPVVTVWNITHRSV